MPRLIKVAQASAIPPGEALAVDVENEELAIFNVDGKFYAITDTCPHAGGPLSEGWVEDGEITCPWHGWSFELSDNTELQDGVCRFKVKVEGDDIFIEVPD